MDGEGSIMDLAEALSAAEAWMNEIEGVEGVAQGKVGGRDCITVFVRLEEAAEKIPRKFQGYDVVVEYTDDFHVQT